MSLRSGSRIALVLLVLAGRSVPLGAQADEASIEQSLVCMCGTCPRLVLNSCMCGYAEDMKAEIRTLIAEGKSEDEIIQIFVQRYGERVLSTPVQEGFNLTAYVAPFLAILIGGGFLVLLIRRWKRPGGYGSEEPRTAPEIREDDPYREKLRDELESFKD